MKLALFFSTASVASAFAFQNDARPSFAGCARSSPTCPRFPSLVRPRSSMPRCAAQKGPGNIERPPNEFSRTYRTESVLGTGFRQRDYSISIQAEDGERNALALRFELSHIHMLQADLSMRREVQIKGVSNRASGVEVEGTVTARVTQTCVRTGENFEVDLEFPLFAVVRPIVSLVRENEVRETSELETFFADERKARTKKDSKAVRTPERNINEMDMMELQRLLQDFDLDDDVFEDEAIYTTDGVIDIGELVSQLFWLKLDPYPKKPGTGPVQRSITG